MEKIVLLHYLLNISQHKYGGAINTEEEAIKKQKLDEVIKAMTTPANATGKIVPADDTKNTLETAKFFSKLDIPDEDKDKINFSGIYSKQLVEVKKALRKFVVAIRPRRTDTTPVEPIHEYEKYLSSKYPKSKRPKKIPLDLVNDQTKKIRLKYPHEEDPVTSVSLVYFPDTDEAKNSIKNYYNEFYEEQINGLSIPNTVTKNKADLINLLNSIKNKEENGHSINNLEDAVIDRLLNELNADTTNQSNEIGNTKITIPGTYIIGHIAENYNIVVKNETYTRISSDLNKVFSNSNNNNIIVNSIPADAVTINRIKTRNKHIIDQLNRIIHNLQNKAKNSEENIALPALIEILRIIDFDETRYTDPNAFTELIGGYVPTDLYDDLLEQVHILVSPDCNFNLGRFNNFVPLRKPNTPPAPGCDVKEVAEYEEKLKAEYRKIMPELFHSNDYNYKRGRKKYPHEIFKWYGESASIDEKNKTEYTTYYESTYQDYVEYRKTERPVKKITKAPSTLLKKLINSNEFTKTIADILKAQDRYAHKVAEDGSSLTEANKHLFGFLEKLRLNAIIGGLVFAGKSLVSGFSLSALGPIAAGVGGVTVAAEIISYCKRVYITYREIMEERVSISYSKDGLKEAKKYKDLIAAADPTTDAEAIARYERIIQAYIAYYVANYRKFERSYARLTKLAKDEWQDEKESMLNDITRYKTPEEYGQYWAGGESEADKYEDLDREEFDKKVEAISHGRSRY